MNPSDEWLYQYMSELDPASDLSLEASEDQLPAALSAVTLREEERARSAVLRPRAWVRPVLGVGAVVATLVLVDIGLSPSGQDEGPSDEHRSSVAMALLSAGGVARAQAATPESLISYASVLTGVISGTVVEKPFNLMLRERAEVWLRSDGSGRLRSKQLEPEWPSDRDRRRWVEFGAPDWPEFDSGAVENKVYGPGGMEGVTREGGLIDGGLPPSRELPTDPGALRELVYSTAEKSRNETDYRAFALVSAILTQPGASPDLKAAGYEVLAGIPGIELIEGAADPTGRVGTGIRMDYGDGSRTTLIFDPGTAQPFAEVDEVTTAPSNAYASPVVGYVLVEETGQVADLYSRP